METGGPYLVGAVFCRNAEQGPDQAISLDGVTTELVVLREPADRDGLDHTACEILLWVAFIAGELVGRGSVTVHMLAPDGGSGPALAGGNLEFQGGPHLVTASLVLRMQPSLPGWRWFEVRLDGVAITRVPLALDFRKRLQLG